MAKVKRSSTAVPTRTPPARQKRVPFPAHMEVPGSQKGREQIEVRVTTRHCGHRTVRGSSFPKRGRRGEAEGGHVTRTSWGRSRLACTVPARAPFPAPSPTTTKQNQSMNVQTQRPRWWQSCILRISSPASPSP